MLISGSLDSLVLSVTLVAEDEDEACAGAGAALPALFLAAEGAGVTMGSAAADEACS